jgi:lipoyl(octanoyl) transferase
MSAPAPHVRLLSYAVADGPHNMAVDETLLSSAGEGVASLRLYGWGEPTLSLGYFQPEDVRHSDPRLAALPFVRRPSGGDTLVHHHEVTYCLALPAGKPWQTSEPWLGRMHGILSTALADCGVRVAVHPATDRTAFAGPLCFHHHTAGDLVHGTSKVVGSAQRRQRGALMQHGAVLLAASPATPSLPGVRELTGVDLAAERLCDAILAAFVRSTGWRLEPGELTDVERVRIAALVAEKYTCDGWNRKR